MKVVYLAWIFGFINIEHMIEKLDKLDKAKKIIENYTGENPYIKILKCDPMAYGGLTDFNVEYVLENYDYIPEFVNKVVKISEDFGEKLQLKYCIPFAPKKLVIVYVIGKMGDSLHCYVKYAKDQQQSVLMFLNKRYILDDIYIDNYEDTEVDFTPYNKMTEKYGRKLKPHQESGVKFLLSRNKAILADEQGCGKTTTLTVAALAGGFKKILIVCPASLKYNWRDELLYYVAPEEIEIVNGSTWKESKFVIINYDILKNFYEVPFVLDKETGKMVKSRKKVDIMKALENSQLYQSKFDLVIIDECHKLSKSSSMRYKIISDFLSKSNPKALFLSTGTPITNNTVNLYSILKLINADIVKDYNFYMRRYCGGRKVWNKYLGRDVLIPNGCTNLDELKEKIKHYYIRRLITDIGIDIKSEKKILKYDLNAWQRAKYDALWTEYQNAQLLSGNDMEKYKSIIEGTILRQWAANEMIPNTIDIVESHIEYGEKVIIMCSYDEEVEQLREHFKSKCVVYNGKMTALQKEKAKKAFMEDPKKMVFIGNIIAAGVGLTLISANVCVFNSYDWVPGNNEQAERRIVRIGQQKECHIYYQIFNDTIFERMYNIVSKKDSDINAIIKTENEKQF